MFLSTLARCAAVGVLAGSLAGAAPQDTDDTTSADWPSFRGAHARGVAEGFPLPVEWDVAEGDGIAWRTPIPGLAHSSPVVQGERVFVTTAERIEGESELASLYGSAGYGAGDSVEDEGRHAFRLVCLDKETGEVLWRRTAHEGVPAVKRHPKSSHANSTPACNGEVVVAFFGSEGLHAYDLEGEPLWSRDFGVLDAGAPNGGDEMDTDGYQWGFASSPVLEGDRVVVQCDVQGQSFVAVLDAKTGKDVWRTERDEDPTWSTPTVHPHAAGDRAQVIVNGYTHAGGYDLATGEPIWSLSGGGDVPVPTPIVQHDLIFLTSAHGRMAPIRAVHVDAEGDLGRDPRESEAMAWSHPRRGIYMQTPIVYGDQLYLCSDGGILACYDAGSGEELYRERLGDGRSGFSASAVAGDGKLYFTGEGGSVFVVGAGPHFELLAVNELGETCMATPAVSAGRLFFRTRGYVVAVGE